MTFCTGVAVGPEIKPFEPDPVNAGVGKDALNRRFRLKAAFLLWILEEEVWMT